MDGYVGLFVLLGWGPAVPVGPASQLSNHRWTSPTKTIHSKRLCSISYPFPYTKAAGRGLDLGNCLNQAHPADHQRKIGEVGSDAGLRGLASPPGPVGWKHGPRRLHPLTH